MKKVLLSTTALALMFGATAASAQVPTATKDPAALDYLTGSDTLVNFVGTALSSAGASVSGFTYNGIGSSSAQRQLEGGYTQTGEPTCTPNGAANNPGCQEIAPMSRLLNSSVCDDYRPATDPNPSTYDELPGQGQALAICSDEIVVVSDNASHDACGGAAAAIGGTKVLPVSGYSIGGNGVPAWRDVLRLVYTGCTNADPASCTLTNTRKTRCAAGGAREELINTWSNLFAASCSAGTCSGGLRAAYRRDDNSGTTGVFLGFLKVPNDPATNLPQRTQLYGVIGNTTAASNSHAFCDGGDLEACFNDASGAPGAADFSDPIRKTCSADDELCCADGKMGVVRAIRSVAGEMVNATAFPTKGCTPGVFKLTTLESTGLKVCPTGQAGTLCWMPANTESGTNFNCINRASSRAPGFPNVDGRAWNLYVHKNGASAAADRIDPNFANLPDVAQWRQNMANPPPALGPQNLTAVCQERDATSQIACLTGKTTCTLGWAGGEAAFSPTYSAFNEKFDVGNGALARKLYINALGGFGNVTSDCGNHTGNPAFCQGQVNFVNYLINNPAQQDAACQSSGFTPLTASEKAQSCINGVAACNDTVTTGPASNCLAQ